MGFNDSAEKLLPHSSCSYFIMTLVMLAVINFGTEVLDTKINQLYIQSSDLYATVS